MDKTYVDGIREAYRDGFKDDMGFALKPMNKKKKGTAIQNTKMGE